MQLTVIFVEKTETKLLPQIVIVTPVTMKMVEYVKNVHTIVKNVHHLIPVLFVLETENSSQTVVVLQDNMMMGHLHAKNVHVNSKHVLIVTLQSLVQEAE
jgi:hypothetical protein